MCRADCAQAASWKIAAFAQIKTRSKGRNLALLMQETQKCPLKIDYRSFIRRETEYGGAKFFPDC
jgi:hypothetical protein